MVYVDYLKNSEDVSFESLNSFSVHIVHIYIHKYMQDHIKGNTPLQSKSLTIYQLKVYSININLEVIGSQKQRNRP